MFAHYHLFSNLGLRYSENHEPPLYWTEKCQLIVPGLWSQHLCLNVYPAVQCTDRWWCQRKCAGDDGYDVTLLQFSAWQAAEKFQTPNHRNESRAFCLICYDQCTCTMLVSGVLAGRGHIGVGYFAFNWYFCDFFQQYGCSWGTFGSEASGVIRQKGGPSLCLDTETRGPWTRLKINFWDMAKLKCLRMTFLHSNPMSLDRWSLITKHARSPKSQHGTA